MPDTDPNLIDSFPALSDIPTYENMPRIVRGKNRITSEEVVEKRQDTTKDIVGELMSDLAEYRAQGHKVTIEDQLTLDLAWAQYGSNQSELNTLKCSPDYSLDWILATREAVGNVLLLAQPGTPFMRIQHEATTSHRKGQVRQRQLGIMGDHIIRKQDGYFLQLGEDSRTAHRLASTDQISSETEDILRPEGLLDDCLRQAFNNGGKLPESFYQSTNDFVNYFAAELYWGKASIQRYVRKMSNIWPRLSLAVEAETIGIANARFFTKKELEPIQKVIPTLLIKKELVQKFARGRLLVEFSGQVSELAHPYVGRIWEEILFGRRNSRQIKAAKDLETIVDNSSDVSSFITAIGLDPEKVQSSVDESVKYIVESARFEWDARS